MKNESDSSSFQDLVITEVSTVDQIPKEWRNTGSLLWNNDEDQTPEDFLKSVKNNPENDLEYEEYIRLRLKFENL